MSRRLSYCASCLCCLGYILAALPTGAASLTWDVTTGDAGVITDGAGTWSTGAFLWNDNLAWTNNATTPDDAVFGGGTSGTAGTVTVSGTVNVNNITFNTPFAGTYTIGGTALTLGGSGATTPTITVNGATNAATISAPLAGSNGLTVTGTGTLSLSATETYTGTTIVSGGTLALTGNRSFNGGVFNTGTHTFQVNTGATLSLTGDWTSCGAFTALTSFNINGGTLTTVNSGADVDGARQYVNSVTMTGGTISGAGIRIGNGGVGTTPTYTINAAATSAVISGPVILVNTATNTPVFDVADGAADNDLLISGVIKNFSSLPNLGILKKGAGTMALSGVNTFTGPVTISVGTLKISNSNGLGTSGTGSTPTLGDANTGSNPVALLVDGGISGIVFPRPVTVSTNGTGTATVGSSAGSGATITLSGTITLNRDTIIQGKNTDRTTFTGVITGAGNITIDSAGTTNGRVTFDNNGNNFTGSLTVNANTVFQLNNSTVVDTAAGIVNNGRIKFNTTAASFKTLSGNGIIQVHEVVNASPTLTVGNGNGSSTFAGVIQNGGTGGATVALAKVGSGTLTLTGTNTYTGGTTISAGTLQLGDDTTLTGSIVGNITNNSALIVANPANLTLAGAISGTGTLAKNGAGTLILTGASTFSGGTTITTGSVQLGNGTSTDGSLAGNITNNATLVFANVNALTSNNVISGAGNLTKSAGGTLTITGSNSYSGGTTINGGSVAVALDAASGNAPLGVAPGTTTPNNVVLNGGGLSATASLTLNSNRGIGLGPAAGGTGGTGTLDVASGQTMTYNGVVASAGNTGTNNLIKSGAGTLMLGGVNTYSGNTSISGGTLYVIGSLPATGSVTVGSSNRLGGTGSVGATTVDAGGTIEAGYNGLNSLTLASLAFAGIGSVSIGVVDPYVSTPAVNVTGTLTTTGLANAIPINIAGAGLNNGTYKLIGFSSSIDAATFGSFYLGTTPGVGARQSATLQNNSTNIALVVAGDLPVWTGINSTAFSGGNNWKLQTGLTVTDYQNNDTVVFDDTAAGTKTVDISGGAVTPASVTFNNATANYTLQGTSGISGSTGLSKNNTGTLTITNVNSYTGATSITAGTVKIGNANALPNGTGTGNVVLDGGSSAAGTLDLNGTSIVYLNGLSGISGTVLGQVINSGAGTATLNVGVGDATATFSGLIKDNNGSGGTVALQKSGSGTQVLAGANTYSGGTTVLAGVLQLADATALGAGSLTVDGGKLDLNSHSYTVPGLQGSGGVITDETAIAGTTTLTVTQTTATNFSGSIQNGASNRVLALTLNGAGGALTLAGTNTYTGPTTIVNGTLKVGASGTLPTGSGKGNVVLDGGATEAGVLDLNGFDVTLNGVTGATGTVLSKVVNDAATTQTLTLGNANTASTFAGVIADHTAGTGVVALAKIGSAAVTLSGPNTYSGGTTITAGTLVAGSSTALGTGTITLNGGTLNVNDQSLANAVMANDSTTSTIRGGGTLTGNISGTGNITKAGTSNTLVLQGDNSSFAGTFTAGDWRTFLNTANSGSANATWQIDFGTMIGAGYNAALNATIKLGALTGSGKLGAGFNTAGSTITYEVGGNNANTTFSGIIADQENGDAGTGAVVSLTKVGTGTLTLSGTSHSYTGVTTVDAGTLALSGSAAFEVSMFTGGNHSIVVNPSGTLLLSGFWNVSGNAAATQTSVTINGGTLTTSLPSADPDGAPQYLTNVTMTGGTISGAGIRISGNNATYTINASATGATISSLVKLIKTAGTASPVFNVADGAAAADLTISGDVKDYNSAALAGLAFTKTGAGTLVLSGNNTYIGGTNINGGVLSIDSINDGATSRVGGTTGGNVGYVAIKDATLQITGAGSYTTVRNLWVDQGAATFDITDPAGSLTWTPANNALSKSITKAGPGTMILNGPVSGSAGVTVTGGTLNLTAANTYTGDTTVTAGTLNVPSLNSAGATLVGPNAALNTNRILQASLTLQGSVGNEAGITTINLSTSTPAAVGDPTKVSRVNTLTIADNAAGVTAAAPGTAYSGPQQAYYATLDLKNNDLIVNNGNLAMITDQLRSGVKGLPTLANPTPTLDNPNWNGTGISSSYIGSVSGTALGVMRNVLDPTKAYQPDSQLPDYNPARLTAFDSETLSGNEILVKHTWYGDLDLDGTITSFDFALLDAGNAGSKQADGSYGWFFGDLNYNGLIDSQDYSMLLNGYTGFTTYNGGGVALPEPSTLALGLLGVGGLLSAFRRRR